MKHAILALMLSLSATAIYAQQPVKMNFSGTWVPTAINQQPNSVTDVEQLGGNGTFGSFSLLQLRTDGTAPQASSSCAGPALVNVPVLAGAGAFRYNDGSLLTIELTNGGLCIDFSVLAARMNETFKVTGGTGRFKNASGTLTLNGTVRPLMFTSNPDPQAILLIISGQITGTVSGVGNGDDQ